MQDVARPRVGADLPRVHLREAVVVADGAEAGRVGVQRDRRQRAPVAVEPADQLRGEVLRLRGAAPVARGEQPVAGHQPAARGPRPSGPGWARRRCSAGSARSSRSTCAASSAASSSARPAGCGPPAVPVRRPSPARSVSPAPARALPRPGSRGPPRATAASPSTAESSSGGRPPTVVHRVRYGHARPLGEHLLVHGERAVGDAVPAVAGQHAVPAGDAERQCPGGRGQQRPQRGGQRVGPPRRARAGPSPGPRRCPGCRRPRWRPPGRPHAMASSGTIPNGSYQGTHTTASAERSSAGTSGRATAPSSRTRSATPAAAAACRSRRASGSPSQRRTVLAGAVGPPATSSSTPGNRRSAAITSSTPLRRTSRPSTTSRGRSARGAHRPVGRERGRVDPARHHGGRAGAVRRAGRARTPRRCRWR